MNNRVLSIEIGNSFTKICEMDYKVKKPKVYKVLTVETPEGIVVDGMLQPTQEYADRMVNALGTNGIRTKKVIFTIFSVLSLVCILISTFGIYSLVSLATEQRRKEIAIRKVNGATFCHILQLFFREYFLLVALGNAFALPVGYLVTKRWFETYANHTTLPVWLFLLVFLITSGIVLLSIFRQVKRAAATNPAEIIKTE